MKKLKKIVLLMAMYCLFVGGLNIHASEGMFEKMPQENINIVKSTDAIDVLASPSLTACNLGIGIADNGLLMTFDTTATQIANEIGVKNVILQEKTLFGWKDIPVSNYYTRNSDWYSVDVVYTAATKGTTYRIKCTHYAKFGSTELTLNNTSSELTYN
ncbi:MAG TPA: hypothetical protein H9700_13200 [Candidatus Eisenbergiella intestinipullorum]|nr:hypothetical protein [Candidatus Eisenbergiella intestinipullorum]